MPPRGPPKVHHLLIKTHKLTVVLTLPPSTTIASVKEDVLSALTSDVNQNDAVPKVTSDADFELCKGIKTKGKITEYQLMDANKTLKEYALPTWEHLFLQFRDLETGDLLPITYVEPPIGDEGDETASVASSEADNRRSNVSKGKRKAHPD